MIGLGCRDGDDDVLGVVCLLTNAADCESCELVGGNGIRCCGSCCWIINDVDVVFVISDGDCCVAGIIELPSTSWELLLSVEAADLTQSAHTIGCPSSKQNAQKMDLQRTPGVSLLRHQCCECDISTLFFLE